MNDLEIQDQPGFGESPAPREFWICEFENEVCGSKEDLERIAPESTPIHVIEFSAYEEALRVIGSLHAALGAAEDME